MLKKHSLIFLLFLLTFSCSRPKQGDKPLLDYNKIIDSSNRLFDDGKAQQAVTFLDSATATYKKLGTIQRFYYYQTNYNFFYHKKNDTRKAMLYADSMLSLFNSNDKRINHIAQYAQSFFFKGDILFDENKYEEAYQYYYQGKIIANNGMNDCTMGDYNYRMGMIMYKQEHYQLAANYFKISSTQTNTCDWSIRSFYRRQELLSNTGLSYSKINKPDSAMLYFDKAVNYINTYGKTFRERDLMDAALGVYMEMKPIFTLPIKTTGRQRLC